MIDQKPVKVLVVEDHPGLREFLECALTMLGWDVAPSKNGKEALEKLRQERPSLILLDMRMPEMDGFTLMQTLKSDPSYECIPILAVTGLGTPEDRKLCLEAGCDDYLLKPFALPDLHDRMIRLVLAQDPAVHAANSTGSPPPEHWQPQLPTNFTPRDGWIHSTTSIPVGKSNEENTRSANSRLREDLTFTSCRSHGITETISARRDER